MEWRLLTSYDVSITCQNKTVFLGDGQYSDRYTFDPHTVMKRARRYDGNNKIYGAKMIVTKD